MFSATPVGRAIATVAGLEKTIDPVAAPISVRAVPKELRNFVFERKKIPS